MKIQPVGAELVLAYGHEDITKLTVDFRQFTKALAYTLRPK